MAFSQWFAGHSLAGCSVNADDQNKDLGEECGRDGDGSPSFHPSMYYLKIQHQGKIGC